MLLNLTDLSAEPLQSQIVRQVRAKILSGELTTGADLPSIRKMAREQHISVITVQRAYETLELQGLIHSRRGKGFFVSEMSKSAKKDMALARLKDNLRPQLQAAQAEGLDKGEINQVVATLLNEKEAVKK